MTDYEKLGAFSLGRHHDPAAVHERTVRTAKVFNNDPVSGTPNRRVHAGNLDVRQADICRRITSQDGAFVVFERLCRSCQVHRSGSRQPAANLRRSSLIHRCAWVRPWQLHPKPSLTD